MPKRQSSGSVASTDNNAHQPPPSKKRKIGEDEMSTQEFLTSQREEEYVLETNKENIHRQSGSRSPPHSGGVANIIKSMNGSRKSNKLTPSRNKSKTPSRNKKKSLPSQQSNSVTDLNQSLQLNQDENIQTAAITINGVTEHIDMRLLRNIGYFHRKLARPSMEIVPDKKKSDSKHRGKLGELHADHNNNNNGDDVETYKFDFNITAFEMKHFQLLVKYCNESEHKNDDLEKPKIATQSIEDLEKFMYAADYFLVYDVSSADIEKCYGQCNQCESTHELLKKWKKSKMTVLSEFASHLQRKLHPLSSKIGVDKLIEIMDAYIAHLNECEQEMVRDEQEYEEELVRLRASLQIYWIHYIKGKTYFWNIYSILKKMNEFLSKLKHKKIENPNIVQHKLFDHLPYITLIYAYVDFVNCIQRMKDGTVNYVNFVDKMNVNIKELILVYFSKELPDYDISELKKRWYFRLNGQALSNRDVMIELIKTLIWYLMEFHLEDFMIRIFWSVADYVFLDEEYIRAIIKKCNQMEITQLAEILNGCNIQMYAENHHEFEFKYADVITKHCYSSINHNDNIAVLGWRQ